MIPFLTKPIAKIIGILILLVLVIFGIVGFINYIEHEREVAAQAQYKAGVLTTQLDAATQTNKNNAKAFQDLAAQRKIDSEATIKLSAQLTTLSGKYDKQIKSINALEKSNEQVKDYLDRVIPDPLRGVLDNFATSSEDDHGVEGGETSAAHVFNPSP